MFGSRSKIAAGLLIAATVPCILTAGINVHNEIWRQWSEKTGWIHWWAGSVHNGFILVLAAIALVNLAILLIVGVWWLANAREPAFPHRGFAAWFALLLVSAVSYFPSDQQYAAVAVILFGPGQKSHQFQIDAAQRDSTMLLDALIARGIQVNQVVLCVAAAHDSVHVLDRLVERRVPVDAECYRTKDTALHNAAAAKQHRSAQILVDAGAKVDLPNIKGDTPLDIARQQRDDLMIRILSQ